jgi:type IV pilus assembly protein PilX
MKILRPTHHTVRPRQERGVALIISMILLVLITMVGLASLRSVVLEEKMAANFYDRSLAFQAAEAGLRAGEAVAVAQATTTPPHTQALALALPANDTQCSSSCSGGICSAPGTVCEGRWNKTDFTGWTTATGVALNTQAGSAPQYFVEFLGNTFPCDPDASQLSDPANLVCARYRVSARSQAGEDRAEVMLQSVYATE